MYVQFQTNFKSLESVNIREVINILGQLVNKTQSNLWRCIESEVV